MILKYQKVTKYFDERHSVVLTLVTPDDLDVRATELCTIGEDTYVHWPDEVALLEQPDEIAGSVEEVVLTTELRDEIKTLCPHVQLS
ncbi:MAG: hypothetical protein RBR67_17515 [Desulfobacterium sp.]|jgi:hypothetical protein|nr:hypothetical protein [Desulfobacterium sp.]